MENHKIQFPLAANTVRQNFYMDYLIPSVPMAEIAKETRRQLTELGHQVGFHIKKGISNRAEILQEIPAADHAAEINLEKNTFTTTKTLGVQWTAEFDTSFNYTIKEDVELTKRNVLKKTATNYDPRGFLAPYVKSAKCLIQRAWIEAGDCDVLLPAHHKEQWKEWFEESSQLQKITIP